MIRFFGTAMISGINLKLMGHFIVRDRGMSGGNGTGNQRGMGTAWMNF